MQRRGQLFDGDESERFKEKVRSVEQQEKAGLIESWEKLGEDIKARQELVRNLPETPGFVEFWKSFDGEKIKAAWIQRLGELNTKDPQQAAEYCLVNAQVKSLDPNLYYELFTDDINLRPKVISYVHGLEHAWDLNQFFKYARALEILRPKEDPQDFVVSEQEWDLIAKNIDESSKYLNFSKFTRLYSEAAFLDLAEISRRVQITDKKWEALESTFKAHSSDPNYRTAMSMYFRAIKPKGKPDVLVNKSEWLAKCKSAAEVYKWTVGDGSNTLPQKGFLQTFLSSSFEVKYANVAQS